MSSINDASWKSIVKLSKIYAYVSFAGIAVGVIAAHLPYLLGYPWTSCVNVSSPLSCVLVFHLYEIPMVTLLIYGAWYALRRLTPATLPNFTALVLLSVIANIAFFTFEITLIMDGLRGISQMWETLLICCVAAILLGGATFGIFVHQRLVKVKPE